MAEKGVGGGGVGDKRSLPMHLALHCHHQSVVCVKMGSGVSHFSKTETGTEIQGDGGEAERVCVRSLPMGGEGGRGGPVQSLPMGGEGGRGGAELAYAHNDICCRHQSE